jgi:flagellin-like protein
MVHIAPRYRKGLEPLIAAIILIAITLVIAIAVVAWILGVFGGTVGGKEELQVFPNTSLISQNTNMTVWNLNMTVRNTGSVSAQIIGITVGNVTCSISPSPFPIGSGETKLVQASCSGNFAPGVSYTIRILTAAGNQFYGYVVAG